MKIDRFELEKQRREEILESGEYARVEIISPRITTSTKKVAPAVCIETKKVNTMTMMCLVSSLESTKKDIMKQDPAIALAQMIFDTEIAGEEIISKGEITEIPD